MGTEDTDKVPEETSTTEETSDKKPSFGIENFGDKDPDEKDSKKKQPAKEGKKPDEKDDKKKDDKPTPRKRKARLSDDTEFEWDDDGSDDVDFGKVTVRRKVDGKEIDVPISQLGKDYELRAASYKRLEENNARDKRFTEAVQALAQNREQMEDFLREHAGIQDPYQWAMEGLKERIEEEQLAQSDPREWKARQQSRMHREFEAQQRREQRLQQAQMQQRQEQEAMERFVERIKTGRKELGLESASALGALNVLEQRFHRMGRDPRKEVDALLREAADIYRDDIRHHVQKLSEEDLLELLGPATIRRLNDFQIRKARNGEVKPAERKPEPEQPAKKPPRKFTSEREIMKKRYGS